MISLFIEGKNFHVATKEFDRIYSVTESRELADNIVPFFEDALLQTHSPTTIVYSSGPATFTTIRIMSALLKGILVTAPNMKFFGISNFLTYIACLTNQCKSGKIAIPTMRGDYFFCDFTNKKILRSGIIQNAENAIMNSDSIFDTFNFAKIQLDFIDSTLLKLNEDYISSGISIDYGFTPEYTNQKTWC